MNDEGIVKEVLAPLDAESGRATVIIGRASACEHCPAGGLCGVKDMEVEAYYDRKAYEHLKVGDAVKIDVPTDGGLKAALLLYALPLLLFGAGMAAALFSGAPEWAAFACGLVLMGITYYFIHRNNKQFEKNKAYCAKIIRVADAVRDEGLGIVVDIITDGL